VRVRASRLATATMSVVSIFSRTSLLLLIYSRFAFMHYSRKSNPNVEIDKSYFFYISCGGFEKFSDDILSFLIETRKFC
jgi:hypothetical protein